MKKQNVLHLCNEILFAVKWNDVGTHAPIWVTHANMLSERSQL